MNVHGLRFIDACAVSYRKDFDVYYGGDYNPEQWPEQMWHEDVRLMKAAGVNLVSLGIFAWSELEPEEGRFEFSWLDRILELLADAGIGVNLGTATASIPPWLLAKHPDIVPYDVMGLPYNGGGRQHFAPTSPQYREHAGELVRRIGERYAHHPAVVMWHVNNELAGHVPWDYSDHAARAFRRWLREHYPTIGSLNEAWHTAVWSERLSDFDEVSVPRRAPSSTNPAGLLDFRRFTSDAALELYTMERDILRAAGALQPITTNFMGAFPSLDYWRWAEEVDLVADDCYPDPRDPESFRTAAFTRDLMHSLKPDTPWVLMEQASNALSWRANNAQKRPGQMAALSEQAMARGAGGIMFFQWRQSISGAEKFHSSMVPHAGTDTRTWREIAALGAHVSEREPLLPSKSRVAMIFDWHSRWAIEMPDHPAELEYLPLVRRWYDVLHATHVQVQFVRPTDDLNCYDLVIAPGLYLLTSEAADNLTSYIEQGGVLVTTPFTDIVDEHDSFRPGGYSMQLAKVFGGRPVDFDGVLPEDGIRVDLEDGSRYSPEHLIEEFELDGGEVLASTNDGRPALVRHRTGSGTSLHATAFPDEAGARHILDTAIALSGVIPTVAGLPSEIEAISTPAGPVLINQSRSTVRVHLPDGPREFQPFEIVRLPAFFMTGAH